MAGLLTETVTVYFDLSALGGAFFTLDDPVKGKLDNVTYLLAGNTATDISDRIRSVQINRGRTRALDDVPAGVGQGVANNQDRLLDPNYAAGAYFGNIRPGKRVTFATNGIVRMDGLIDDWNFDYPVSGDSTAEFDVVDALATLGATEFDEWTSTDGQLPGARLTSILDRSEVQFPASRNIGTGVSVLQSDLVTWGSNALNYAQLIAKCDAPNGQLFVSRDGTLTFYGGDRVLTGVGSPKFSDDGTGIAYSGINVDFGTELLFNRVSVDALGFVKQTVTNQTSIDLYGVRSLSISELPLQTQGQALNLANTLLNQYAFPTSRIATITVDLHAQSAADQATILNLDMGSVIETVYTPNSISTALDQYGLIEGVSELIGPMFHSVTFYLTKVSDGLFGASPFILDDAFYGVLDTVGHGVLAF